jgi:hypothetical protein
MPFKRLLRSKKGIEEEGYRPILKLLPGILVVIAIIGMVTWGGSLVAQEPGGETLKDFKNDFVPAFESVVNGSRDYIIVERMFLKTDQIIAVFSSGRVPLKDTCQINEDFKKPAQCGDSVCACLCSEGDSCERPFDCFQIKNAKKSLVLADSSFDANLGDVSGGGNHVLIYGDCDGAGGEPLGIRDILIETKPRDNVVFISDKTCRHNRGVCMVIPEGKTCPQGMYVSKEFKCPHETPTCCMS